jgi:hypothetical protein
VPDSFLYGEVGGRRHVVVSSIERSRIAGLGGGLVIRAWEDYGYDELVLERAAVPAEFPLELADRLRSDGIELSVDRGR